LIPAPMRTKAFCSRIFPNLLLAILLVGISAVAPSHAAIRTVIGTVIKVSDGDSIQVVTPEQTKLKIRLYGIDAAEMPGTGTQRYAPDARKALESKIKGRQVKLDIIDIDKYRRLVSIVWLDGRNINLEMIQEGHAEAFVEYLKPPYREQFLKAEREARGARLGIWSLPDYERPRNFRKRLKTGGGE